jgi:hypothetical protein
MSWRPIGLYDIEAPPFCRQLVHRLTGSEVFSVMHQLATLYPQENSWYSFLSEDIFWY